MGIKETIEKSSRRVGSQRKLAELLGMPEQTLSNLKNGRAHSYQLHAQIAAAGGFEEEARRILLQGMADQLNEVIPHEAEAKKGLEAILKAFKQTSLRALRVNQILPQDWHPFTRSLTGHKTLHSRGMLTIFGTQLRPGIATSSTVGLHPLNNLGRG